MKSFSKYSKILFLSIFSLFFYLISPLSVLAADVTCDPNKGLNAVFGCDNPFMKSGALDVASIQNTGFTIGLGIFVITIIALGIWGWALFAKAGDNADKRKEALQKVVYAVLSVVGVAFFIGLVFMLVSWSGFGNSVNLTSTPCTARTAYGVTFLGFLAPNSTQVCVLTNSKGDVLRIGCVGGSKTYNGAGRDATPESPATGINLGSLRDTQCN